MTEEGRIGATTGIGATSAEVAEIELVGRMIQFVTWVGAGRKLTQTRRLTLADARALVELLGTGDKINPTIGSQVFRTKSSEELRELNAIVEWAKASRLVRVTGGRLVTVKKNAAVLGRPVDLWARMFEAFPWLGEALCPSGWGESLMRREFGTAAGAMFRLMHAREDAVGLGELYTLAWETVTAPYIIEGTPEQVETARRMNDRDVRHLVGYLSRFGAVRVDGGTGDGDSDAGEQERFISLTDLGRWGVRRFLGAPEPGDPVLRLRVTLVDTSDPVVWRQLLVPATTRLDRLHEVLQAAMGWENSHLHAFSVGPARSQGRAVVYGTPDPDLGHRDETTASLANLVGKDGDRLEYTYDFGDSWDHEIVVEASVVATANQTYPICVAGEGACPPEDCGGVGGYLELRAVLADPDNDEHESMLEWMGLDKAADFDPARLDLDEINRRLAVLV
jgi:Plasmid pRiA4b ORF-3-like protein